jgi:hypothetical protein
MCLCVDALVLLTAIHLAIFELDLEHKIIFQQEF